MKSKLLSILGILAVAASALAIPLARVGAAEPGTIAPKLPVIPKRSLSVTDFGAVGDGATMNTQAFHAAIEACVRAGGGRIVVPDGIFLTGPVELKSLVDLHLAKGATIRMSQRLK